MATVDQVDKAASTDNSKPGAQEAPRGGKAGKADGNNAAAKAEAVKKTAKAEKGMETPAQAEKKKAAGSPGAFKEKDKMDEEVKTVKSKAAPEKAAAKKTAAAAAVKDAPKKEKAPKAAPKAVASAAEEPEKAKAKAAPKKAAAPKAEAIKEEPKKEEVKAVPKKAAAPKAEAIKEEPKKEEAKAAPKKAAAPKAEAIKEEPKKEEVKAAPKKAAAPKAEAIKEEPKKEEAAPAINKEAQKSEPAPAPAAKPAAAAPAQAAKPAQAAPAAPKKKEAAPVAKRTSQNRMRDYYKKTVVPQLMKEFAFKNINEVPRLEKITLNMRMGDIKDNSKSVNSAMDELKTISGQRPVSTKARKSLANWKIREGMIIGAKVTLRGDRMYDFYDKLVSIALPRVRDFRGVSPKAFDGRGNYATGIKEQLIFPEISYEQVEKVRGFDICIVTSAETDEHAKALLKAMGMPFKA